jgi:hypothetical protein
MTSAKLSGQKICEFDLTDFTLNLIVSHLGLEIMLESVLTQQLYKELLSKVGECRRGTLFNE